MISSVFQCLAHEDRRQLLGFLYEQSPDAVSQGELGLALHSYKRGGDDPSNGSIQRTLAGLHHTHFPILHAAGIIEHDTVRDAVTLTDHPAFQDSGIVDIIRTEATVDSGPRDALFRALADHERRTILDVLSHQFQPIHIETLARKLEAKEQEATEQMISVADIEPVLGRLKHVQLPRLRDAELIDYDEAEQRISYAGRPEVQVPWLHSVLEPNFRRSLTGETEIQEVGVIEGREDVVSYGQYLVERAEEELFCMFTNTDMLEAGCFARIKAAAQSGVAVYLGTRDPAVRRYVQDEVPAVTLWEPEAEWWSADISGDRVGRLILADRDAVMLGTLTETTDQGDSSERAIVGDGSHNTLASLVRQLVGPHLDEIDKGTGDIESQLPF